MMSVFERAIGPEFDSLHPAIKKRFSLTSEDQCRCVGRGTMATIDRNPLAIPALWWLARGNVLFPERGSNVPFEVRTYPFEDRDGTETVAYIRRYETDPIRRFDAYMTYDDDRACVVDYLGKGRHLVSELNFSVTDEGRVSISAGDQWIVWRGRRFQLPSPFRASVAVEEGYDKVRDRFTVDVTVSNQILGRVFHYDGWFTVDYEDCPSLQPEDAPTGWEQPVPSGQERRS
jgi:hypothetical protein